MLSPDYPTEAIAIIGSPSPETVDWAGLLACLQAAFAYMDGRIDPPSSLHGMDAAALRRKAEAETLILALRNGRIAGCLFARTEGACLYVGKIAVLPALQGAGIGRRLFAAAFDLARQAGAAALELETRIELTENHATFAALGFAPVSEHAHPGYDRVTYLRMRAPVPGR